MRALFVARSWYDGDDSPSCHVSDSSPHQNWNASVKKKLFATQLQLELHYKSLLLSFHLEKVASYCLKFTLGYINYFCSISEGPECVHLTTHFLRVSIVHFLRSAVSWVARFVTETIISFTVIGYFTFSMGGLVDCCLGDEKRDKSFVYFLNYRLTRRH